MQSRHLVHGWPLGRFHVGVDSRTWLADLSWEDCKRNAGGTFQLPFFPSLRNWLMASSPIICLIVSSSHHGAQLTRSLTGLLVGLESNEYAPSSNFLEMRRSRARTTA